MSERNRPLGLTVFAVLFGIGGIRGLATLPSVADGSLPFVLGWIEAVGALATGVFLWRRSRQALVTFAVAVLMVMTRVSLVEYQDGGWAYVAIVVAIGTAVNAAIFAYLRSALGPPPSRPAEPRPSAPPAP